jgi:hypothetical protein
MDLAGANVDRNIGNGQQASEALLQSSGTQRNVMHDEPPRLQT